MIDSEPDFTNELSKYATTFNSNYGSRLKDNWNSSHTNSTELYEECYGCGMVFQTLNSIVDVDASCLESLREIQSDAVASFTEAMLGLYKNAISTCRRILEHSICHIYFSYHPIEYEWWMQANYNFEFTGHSNFVMKMDAYKQLDALIGINSELVREYKSLSKFVHGHGSKYMHSFESSLNFKYEKKMLNIWGSHYRNTCRLSTILIIVNNHDNWYESSQTERDIISNVLQDKDKRGIAKVLDDSDFFDKHL